MAVLIISITMGYLVRKVIFGKLTLNIFQTRKLRSYTFVAISLTLSSVLLNYSVLFCFFFNELIWKVVLLAYYLIYLGRTENKTEGESTYETRRSSNNLVNKSVFSNLITLSIRKWGWWHLRSEKNVFPANLYTSSQL